MKNRQRTRRISLNENHNRYMGSGGIDVQIVTNTKEPNQVNLNSSSATTTSAEAALPASLPLAQIAQQPHTHPHPHPNPHLHQQHQLIVTPTTMTGKYHPAHAKLRRCKSTPSLNCDGMAEPMEEDQLHRFAACSRNPAAEAQQHAQPSCNSSSSSSSDGSCNSNKCSSNICGAQPTTPESLRFGCAHYKRRAMFVVSATGSPTPFILSMDAFPSIT